MIGIISLISVNIPVLANDLFRYWFREQGNIDLRPVIANSRFESWGSMFKQERAPRNEIRILFFSYQAKRK